MFLCPLFVPCVASAESIFLESKIATFYSVSNDLESNRTGSKMMILDKFRNKNWLFDSAFFLPGRFAPLQVGVHQTLLLLMVHWHVAPLRSCILGHYRYDVIVMNLSPLSILDKIKSQFDARYFY